MARMIEDSNVLRHTIQKYRYDVTIPEFKVVMSEDELLVIMMVAFLLMILPLIEY